MKTIISVAMLFIAITGISQTMDQLKVACEEKIKLTEGQRMAQFELEMRLESDPSTKVYGSNYTIVFDDVVDSSGVYQVTGSYTYTTNIEGADNYFHTISNSVNFTAEAKYILGDFVVKIISPNYSQE